MKKIICICLALLMTIMLCACRRASVPVSETETAPAENKEDVVNINDTATSFDEIPPTEETVATEHESIAEIWLAESGTTVTFETPEEYEEAIHKLGFEEFVLNYYDSNGQLACQPLKLTYTDALFRLDFLWTSDDGLVTEGLVTSEWILYGAKTTEPINWTSMQPSDYEASGGYSLLDGLASDKTKELPYCPRITCNTAFDLTDNNEWERWGIFGSAYYPTTQNQYNFVHQPETLEKAIQNTPRVVLEWDEYLYREWSNQGLSQFVFVCGEINGNVITPNYSKGLPIKNPDGYFEPGMTLIEWVESPYNIEGWTIQKHEYGATLYSRDGEYFALDSGGTLDDYPYFGEVVVSPISQAQK